MSAAKRCRTCGVPLNEFYGNERGFCTAHAKRATSGGVDNRGTVEDFRHRRAHRER